jgi:hypothetical protein
MLIGELPIGTSFNIAVSNFTTSLAILNLLHRRDVLHFALGERASQHSRQGQRHLVRYRRHGRSSVSNGEMVMVRLPRVPCHPARMNITRKRPARDSLLAA